MVGLVQISVYAMLVHVDLMSYSCFFSGEHVPVVYADQQAVVHDAKALKNLAVSVHSLE